MGNTGLVVMNERGVDIRRPKASEDWRLIIHKGRASATYKMALATCIANSVLYGGRKMTWEHLAEQFLTLYTWRLRNGRPQLRAPDKSSVVRRIVSDYLEGRIDRANAIRTMKARGFQYVLSSFHIVGQSQVDTCFFLVESDGLLLTDDAFVAIAGDGAYKVLTEIETRWDELEQAFMSNRKTHPPSLLPSFEG